MGFSLVIYRQDFMFTSCLLTVIEIFMCIHRIVCTLIKVYILRDKTVQCGFLAYSVNLFNKTYLQIS